MLRVHDLRSSVQGLGILQFIQGAKTLNPKPAGRIGFQIRTALPSGGLGLLLNLSDSGFRRNMRDGRRC